MAKEDGTTTPTAVVIADLLRPEVEAVFTPREIVLAMRGHQPEGFRAFVMAQQGRYTLMDLSELHWRQEDLHRLGLPVDVPTDLESINRVGKIIKAQTASTTPTIDVPGAREYLRGYGLGALIGVTHGITVDKFANSYDSLYWYKPRTNFHPEHAELGAAALDYSTTDGILRDQTLTTTLKGYPEITRQAIAEILGRQAPQALSLGY